MVYLSGTGIFTPGVKEEWKEEYVHTASVPEAFCLDFKQVLWLCGRRLLKATLCNQAPCWMELPFTTWPGSAAFNRGGMSRCFRSPGVQFACPEVQTLSRSISFFLGFL